MLKIPTTHFDKRGNSFQLFDPELECTRSGKGVLRGMYLQQRELTVVLGEIYLVLVDMDTGKWESWRLSEKKHEHLSIPPGMAYGYCTLSDTAIVISKINGAQDPLVFRFDDTDVAIDWPIEYPLLSLQDEKGGSFAQVLDHWKRR